MSLSLDDIKKDMKEMVVIINEESVARSKLMEILKHFRLHNTDKNNQLNRIRNILKKESDIAYITGLKGHKISDRFVDKIMDMLSKYGTEELDMCYSIALF